MEPYDIGYAIGSVIPFIVVAAAIGLVIYFAIKQSNKRKNETFQDRDN